MLSHVEKKSAINNYLGKSHKIMNKEQINGMTTDQLYDHIIFQISFIHYPELAYLRKNKYPTIEDKSKNPIP